MTHSCHKPIQLIFDADIGERWRLFEIVYEHFINIVHRNDPDEVKASLLHNLAGPEAMIHAQTFDFAPAVLDGNGQVMVPAETMLCCYVNSVSYVTCHRTTFCNGQSSSHANSFLMNLWNVSFVI